jgi:hypothetical protein
MQILIWRYSFFPSYLNCSYQEKSGAGLLRLVHLDVIIFTLSKELVVDVWDWLILKLCAWHVNYLASLNELWVLPMGYQIITDSGWWENKIFWRLELIPVWHNVQSACSLLHLESLPNIWGRGLKVPASKDVSSPMVVMLICSGFLKPFSKKIKELFEWVHFSVLIATPFCQLNGRWLRQC